MECDLLATQFPLSGTRAVKDTGICMHAVSPPSASGYRASEDGLDSISRNAQTQRT